MIVENLVIEIKRNGSFTNVTYTATIKFDGGNIGKGGFRTEEKAREFIVDRLMEWGKK